MLHLKAIEIISSSLRGAVENTPEGREGMALGQYIAGMGFSNVGLGLYTPWHMHWGAVYDTPHGVANAILFRRLWNIMQMQLVRNIEILQRLWE